MGTQGALLISSSLGFAVVSLGEGDGDQRGAMLTSEISESDVGVEFVALVATNSTCKLLLLHYPMRCRNLIHSALSPASILPPTTLFDASKIHLIRAFHLPGVPSSTSKSLYFPSFPASTEYSSLVVDRMLSQLLPLGPTSTSMPALSKIATRRIATLTSEGVQVAFLFTGGRESTSSSSSSHSC